MGRRKRVEWRRWERVVGPNGVTSVMQATDDRVRKETNGHRHVRK